MRKMPYKTTTFATGKENFMIDIVEYEEVFQDGTTEKMYGSWLYRYNIGTKESIAEEMKKNYKGVSLEEYAEQIFEYCYSQGLFSWYDENYAL